MNRLAEFSGEKHHERGAAVVIVADPQVGCTTGEDLSMRLCPGDESPHGRVAIPRRRMLDRIELLKTLYEPVRRRVILPSGTARGLGLVEADRDILGYQDLRLIVVRALSHTAARDRARDFERGRRRREHVDRAGLAAVGGRRTTAIARLSPRRRGCRGWMEIDRHPIMRRDHTILRTHQPLGGVFPRANAGHVLLEARLVEYGVVRGLRFEPTLLRDGR